MTIEKEVTIYVESFIDALEIVDKMDESRPHSVIFMDEEDFLECKCHVVIDETLFIFYPVAYTLFKTKKPESRYKYHLKEDKDENSSGKIVNNDGVDHLDT